MCELILIIILKMIIVIKNGWSIQLFKYNKDNNSMIVLLSS